MTNTKLEKITIDGFEEISEEEFYKLRPEENNLLRVFAYENKNCVQKFYCEVKG